MPHEGGIPEVAISLQVPSIVIARDRPVAILTAGGHPFSRRPLLRI
jgi:hypothetical protein